MSASRTIIDLRARLDDAIISARQEAKDSRKIAPNSFGHGYDQGFFDALKMVLNTINGEEDNIL